VRNQNLLLTQLSLYMLNIIMLNLLLLSLVYFYGILFLHGLRLFHLSIILTIKKKSLPPVYLTNSTRVCWRSNLRSSSFIHKFFLFYLYSLVYFFGILYPLLLFRLNHSRCYKLAWRRSFLGSWFSNAFARLVRGAIKNYVDCLIDRSKAPFQNS